MVGENIEGCILRDCNMMVVKGAGMTLFLLDYHHLKMTTE